MTATNAVVQLDGVSKAFGDRRAVEHLSLTVRRGEVFALLGPNGAAKTSRLVCAGALRASRGTARDEECRRKAKPRGCRRYVHGRRLGGFTHVASLEIRMQPE